jgi:regulatory subunit for Cdc7p protein kinase
MSQSRGPLLARPPPHQSPSHPGRIIRSPNSSGKRTRSPEPSNEARLKRVKPSTHTNTPTRKEDRPERDERRIEREARDAEFRSKYRKAFPTWVFHFAADAASNPEVDDLKANLEMLGAVRLPSTSSPITID